jgi:hypothetical protein
MRYPLDDSIYAVDNVWLGPPGKTTPWRARYVAYFLGAIVFVLVQVVERRMGIAIGFFPIAYGLIATVLITRGVLKLVNYDRPLFALFAAVGNEVSAPRRETRPIRTSMRPNLLPTLGDEEWSEKPTQRSPVSFMLRKLEAVRGQSPQEPVDEASGLPEEAPEETDQPASIFDQASAEGWSRSEPGSRLVLSKSPEPTQTTRPARVRLPRRTLRGSARTDPAVQARSGLSELPHYGRDRRRYASQYNLGSAGLTVAPTVTEPPPSSLDTVSARETKETP